MAFMTSVSPNQKNARKKKKKKEEKHREESCIGTQGSRRDETRFLRETYIL